MTRKGFFALIVSAFVGAKVAPAKALSFKAGDRIALDFAAPPVSYTFRYTACVLDGPASKDNNWGYRVVDVPTEVWS